MATSLDLDLAGLPEDIAADIEAHVNNLTAAHPNRPNVADGIERDEARTSFESYASERCGEGASAPGPADD